MQTSAISLLVPPTTNLNNLRERLRKELSTASNIQNRLNRQSVQDGLKKITEYVSELKVIPETGIALFAQSYI